MTMPFTIDPDEAIEWLVDEWDGSDAEQLLTMLGRVGRIAAVHVLDAVHETGPVIDADVLAGAVASVWSGADFPEDQLGRERWLGMFRDAGGPGLYIREGTRAERPYGPIRLYRGAPRHRRLRMAWTDEVATARRFASGDLRMTQRGEVWQAVVAPERVLAYISEDGRHESEWIIDPYELAVERMPESE